MCAGKTKQNKPKTAETNPLVEVEMMQGRRSVRLYLVSCVLAFVLLVLIRNALDLRFGHYEAENYEQYVAPRQVIEVSALIKNDPQFKEVTLYEPRREMSEESYDSRDSGISEVVDDTPMANAETDPTTTTTQSAGTLTDQLKSMLQCKDRALEMEKLQDGEYWLVRNFVRGTISTYIGCAEAITLTTNGDYTFFSSLAMLVSRWRAPVSFAVYAPGYDLNATMNAIQHVRNCLAESELIRNFVTFHVFFPATHLPDYLPLTEDDALSWDYECDANPTPPYENVDRQQMYRTAKKLTYPINVGRNIARKAANTHFIFASDVELFPSLDLSNQFLAMVARNQSILYGGDRPRVFPLPVFELAANATIPETKKELASMLKAKQARPFHWNLCRNCHLVPKQDAWARAAAEQELSVFAVTKREGKFAFWEPFYISDNREPVFDERVTWEGQSNKRIQGYAMCLLDYEYHVLHPAFLVHTPGIKKFDPHSPRLKYVGPMNRLIKNKIMPEYKVLYGNKTQCKV